VTARRFGVPTPYILAVGTIEPRKNLALLLGALCALGRREVHLAVVGADGWGAGQLRAQVDRLGLSERVHWLGRLADDMLAPLYTSAVALAFPSRYEGFAFPPLEAMASGTPVVALNLGPLPEICGSGTDGAAELVEPNAEALAAGLARLLDDAGHRGELIERGRRRAGAFTWERCARETAAVYAAVRRD
jgi:alpha-1,3-rhamnosyl/mannosyltransferase